MSIKATYPDYVWWLIPDKLAGMSHPPLEDLPQLYQAGFIHLQIPSSLLVESLLKYFLYLIIHPHY